MKLPVKASVKRTVLAVSLLAGLSACGGGGGDGGNNGQANVDGSSVPASAVANTAAFVAYLNSLPQNDTGEPLNASSVTPPTNDTDEPTDV